MDGIGRKMNIRFRAELAMKRKTKQSPKKLSCGGLLIALAAVIFVVILLLRLMVFVTSHGRHRF